MNKNWINKLIKFKNSDEFKILILNLIILFCLIFFHETIEFILNNTLVKYVFSKIKISIINDFIIYILGIGIITYYLLKGKKYILSNNSTLQLILISVYYSYYRWYSYTWEFISLYFINSIMYLDIIYLITGCQLILLIINNKNILIRLFRNEQIQISSQNEVLLSDNPINDEKEDLFGYNKLSKQLAEMINSISKDKKLTIGIDGKWGSGKTSFINLLKIHIKKEDFIIIDFSPWKNESEKIIIQDFFNTINESLSPYHGSINDLLMKYSKNLIDSSENCLNKLFSFFISLFVNKHSIKYQFDKINKIITKINKKIIIFIDDIDRIDSEEIIEVIRLIRNTANFNNIIYFAAYDKNYINNALKSQNFYNYDEFLEKIIQLEINLTLYNKEILLKNFEEKIIRLNPEIFNEYTLSRNTLEFDSHPIFHLKNGTNYLINWLSSIRDVNRLVNGLTITLKELSNEILFEELVKLEILKLKHPEVLEILYSKKTEIFKYANNPVKDIYVLQNYNLSKNETNGIYKTNFDFFLSNSINIPQNKIIEIISLVNSIFPETKIINEKRNNLSIVNPSKFELYFSFHLNKTFFLEKDFIDTINSSLKNIEIKLKKWIENGYEYELQSRFVEIKDFNSKEQFEKIIKSILYFANLEKKDNSPFSNRYVGYDNNDFKNKINDLDKRISNKLYNEINEYRNFLESIFINARYPYNFESEIIYYLKEDSNLSIPIDINELRNISLMYLEKFCTLSEKFDNFVYSLYHRCKYNVFEEIQPGHKFAKQFTPSEAKTILINFLNKDLDGFLQSWIRLEYFGDNLFAIDNFPNELFGDWIAFEKYLYQQDENSWIYLKEFKKLFQLYKKNKFEEYVPFSFETSLFKFNQLSNK